MLCPHCKNDFEVESTDQVSIYNAKIPLFSIKCTECNRNTKKNKKDSESILEKFPDLQNEIEQAKAELEQAKAAKAALDDEDDRDAGAGDFEEKFRDQLSIFGLNSKKYENKIKAVLKLIERTGATRDWLKYHMQKLNFGNKSIIESVVDLVFLDESDAGPMPPYPATGGGGSAQGYGVHTLPGGQVILMPAQTHPEYRAAQPIIIDRGGREYDRERVVKAGSDEQVIEEELDEKGKVTKRIIRGGKVEPAKEGNSLIETLGLLKDLGIIGTKTPEAQPRVPDEVRDTLKELKESVIGLSAVVKAGGIKHDSGEVKGVSDKIDKLQEQITQLEKEKTTMRDNEFKEHLNRIEKELGVRAGDYNKPKQGLSDLQFEVDTKHRNLETISGGFDRLSEKVTAPLNKLLENQTKLNAVLMLRNLEKEDGVPPGTYLRAMQAAPLSSDGEVKATVEKWKARAAAPGAV